MLKPCWSNVERKLDQRCFNVVSMPDTDEVSTLCNFKNPTSDFVSFSTSDQRYFNVDLQRWNNIDPMFKCWLAIMSFSVLYVASAIIMISKKVNVFAVVYTYILHTYNIYIYKRVNDFKLRAVFTRSSISYVCLYSENVFAYASLMLFIVYIFFKSTIIYFLYCVVASR